MSRLPLVLIAAMTVGMAAEPNFNIPLWPVGKVPLAVGDAPLDQPFLTAFLPPKEKRNGSAVIIAPGGSNIMLMYGVEGIELAERFNDWGTCAFVLTYRLEPKYHDDARILDGNRALRLLKSRAAEFGIDPKRILFSGYSAGSTMARNVIANSDMGDPASSDPVERMDSKAHTLVMVYGPGKATPKENLKEFPPTFLLSAAWDRGAANGSAQLFLDMNKAGGVAELHMFQRGRHGFGSAYTSPEYGPWMDILKHFLELNQFFGSKK
ncbi:MAG: alpha/beta hydrolase [Acidobacteria bacterium]|nr:alpha/beta hydrolase [Acidobacteriota bacterium]